MKQLQEKTRQSLLEQTLSVPQVTEKVHFSDPNAGTRFHMPSLDLHRLRNYGDLVSAPNDSASIEYDLTIHQVKKELERIAR